MNFLEQNQVSYGRMTIVGIDRTVEQMDDETVISSRIGLAINGLSFAVQSHSGYTSNCSKAKYNVLDSFEPNWELLTDEEICTVFAITKLASSEKHDMSVEFVPECFAKHICGLIAQTE